MTCSFVKAFTCQSEVQVYKRALVRQSAARGASAENGLARHYVTKAVLRQHVFTQQKVNINKNQSRMAPALPDDILHLLCEQLADHEQFDTLFNCANASRALAVPALTHLYRYVLHATNMLYYSRPEPNLIDTFQVSSQISCERRRGR